MKLCQQKHGILVTRTRSMPPLSLDVKASLRAFSCFQIAGPLSFMPRIGYFPGNCFMGTALGDR